MVDSTFSVLKFQSKFTRWWSIHFSHFSARKSEDCIQLRSLSLAAPDFAVAVVRFRTPSRKPWGAPSLSVKLKIVQNRTRAHNSWEVVSNKIANCISRWEVAFSHEIFYSYMLSPIFSKSGKKSGLRTQICNRFCPLMQSAEQLTYFAGRKSSCTTSIRCACQTCSSTQNIHVWNYSNRNFIVNTR